MKTRTRLVSITLLIGGCYFADASVPPSPPPPTNPTLFSPTIAITPITSDALFDQTQSQSTKPLILLEDRQNNQLDDQTLYLGAQMRANAFLANTNETDELSWLMAFPQVPGKHASRIQVHNFSTHFIGNITPWLTTYAETLWSEFNTFPDQGDFQVRKAYALFGDLRRLPFYGYVGKYSPPFGAMNTFSPFSNPMTWHYFHPIAMGGSLGYYQHGLNVVISGIEGGTQTRAVDSGEDDEDFKVANFAANGLYTRPFFIKSYRASLQMGAGYLHGTAYCGGAAHFGPCTEGANPAWDINGTLLVGQFGLNAEFIKTVHKWPATDHRVSALSVEGKYTQTLYSYPTTFSISWGDGQQGGSGTEWEYNRQLVLGVASQLYPNIKVFAEYIRTFGFAPFDNITNPGVSDRSARSNIANIGLTATI